MADTPAGRYAEQLCEKYPTHSTHALARVLVKKFPMGFDAARFMLRYHRGVSCGGGKKLKPNPSPRIPVSIAKEYKPFVIDGKSIGILSDVHIPYHSVAAIECAVKYLKQEKCDTILLNGDIWDCFMLSSFDKDHRGADSVKSELEKVGYFLDYIHEEFPKAKIVYREGNHEYRLERFLMANALELLDMDQFHLPELLSFKKRGIDWVNEKRVIRVGDLSIIHGHELSSGISAPVNPARGLFLKFKASALMGHCHQTSEHTEKTGLGEIISCWSVACLADLNPLYRPINPYNHGYAHVRMYSATDFHVSNRRIIDGKQV
jgi:predicted phosphodiesterase